MPHTEEFLNQAAKRHKKVGFNKVSLKFVSDGVSGPLGTCVITYRLNYLLQQYEYGREIQVNRDRWGDLSESDREQMISHELGHCSTLNRKHNIINMNTNLVIGNLQGGIRKSLMFPWLGEEGHYQVSKSFNSFLVSLRAWERGMIT